MVLCRLYINVCIRSGDGSPVYTGCREGYSIPEIGTRIQGTGCTQAKTVYNSLCLWSPIVWSKQWGKQSIISFYAFCKLLITIAVQLQYN